MYLPFKNMCINIYHNDMPVEKHNNVIIFTIFQSCLVNKIIFYDFIATYTVEFDVKLLFIYFINLQKPFSRYNDKSISFTYH